MARPSVTVSAQGPMAPKVIVVGSPSSDKGFAVVQLAGDENSDTSFEIFVTSRAEGDQLIDAFTQARDLFPEEEN